MLAPGRRCCGHHRQRPPRAVECSPSHDRREPYRCQSTVHQARRPSAVFAGSIMIMIGVFGALSGLAGILRDDFYVAAPHDLYKFDTTAWGWVHLIVGIVVVFAGYGIFSGAVWARTVGVIMAMISAITNFMFIRTTRSGPSSSSRSTSGSSGRWRSAATTSGCDPGSSGLDLRPAVRRAGSPNVPVAPGPAPTLPRQRPRRRTRRAAWPPARRTGSCGSAPRDPSGR